MTEQIVPAQPANGMSAQVAHHIEVRSSATHFLGLQEDLYWSGSLSGGFEAPASANWRHAELDVPSQPFWSALLTDGPKADDS